jgi:hypothetical protein
MFKVLTQYGLDLTSVISVESVNNVKVVQWVYVSLNEIQYDKLWMVISEECGRKQNWPI